MKVFVAGATGVIGRQLVPRLVAVGHEVHGMTRSAEKQELLREQGAIPVVADALNADQVADAVARARPDVIVHQLTAIGAVDTKHMQRDFALTNRLRTSGTDNLLAAAEAVGVQRFVAQSHVTIYARMGGPVKGEDDPVDTTPPTAMQDNKDALIHLERTVLSFQGTGVVLRYGMFYGPGTSLTPGGRTMELIRARKFPIVGGGGGVWSFVHVADAAEATLAAAQHAERGIYNVVDDEPATVSEWLLTLARQIGAKGPWRVPSFLGRLFAGEAGVVMMTELRGASNAKALRELGWCPRHASWRGALTTG